MNSRSRRNLCHTIASIIEAKGLTQIRVAELTGQQQTDTSRIVKCPTIRYGVG
jgi:predicted XRE-type DNA-binding protein